MKSTLVAAYVAAAMVLLPDAGLAQPAPPNSAEPPGDAPQTPASDPPDPSATPAPPVAPAPGPVAAPTVELEPPLVLPTASPPPKPKPPVYSIPWALRPALAPQGVRLESSLALQDKAFTLPFVLTAAYRITPTVSVLLKQALIVNDPVSPAPSGAALVNPLLGMMYTPELTKGLRLPLFMGVTLPIGMGGGGTAAAPPDGTFIAAGSGVYARSGMDNAIMAVNYAVATGGVGLAYIDHGLTAQLEGTVIQLVRVRGGKPLEPDNSRTNLTAALHVGYSLFGGYLVPSVELRAQAWATTPAVVRKDDTKRDQFTYGLGARTKVSLSDAVTLRPGLSYFRPIDDPMSKAGYHIVTLDLPVAF
jgi:hypothetical protein